MKYNVQINVQLKTPGIISQYFIFKTVTIVPLVGSFSESQNINEL